MNKIEVKRQVKQAAEQSLVEDPVVPVEQSLLQVEARILPPDKTAKEGRPELQEEISKLPSRKKAAAIKKRLNQFELEERRRRVAKLRLKGFEIIAISKLMNITVREVKKDLAAVKEGNINKIKTFEQEAYVADSLYIYDEILDSAWKEYMTAPEGSAHKLRTLDLIRATTNDKNKALAECGLLTKGPTQVEVKNTHKIDWDPALQEAVTKVLLERTLQTQLAAPIPDINLLEEHNDLEVIEIVQEDDAETEET